MSNRQLINSNTSPVGWYVASYILRFVVLDEDNERESKRFKVWENTILIQASSPEEAFQKATAYATKESQPYENNQGQPVQFLFEGLTSLLPIYEELSDGAEIIWEERVQSLKNIRLRIRSKEALEVFRNSDT